MNKKKDQEAMDAERLEEFKALYLALRRVCSQCKPVSEEEPTYQEALAFAQKQDWDWAETLLKGMRLAWTEPAGALELLEGLSAPGGFQGQVCYLHGVAQDEQKAYDEAIGLYQKALDSPGYDTHGIAFNAMGIAYSAKGDQGRAIECFQRALDSQGYETPGYALCNMAIAYGLKGDQDKEIYFYEKALDTPGFDASGDAFNNIGIAYSAKGDKGRAIECYRMALDTPNYDSPALTLNNLAWSYYELGNLDLAREAVQKAHDLGDEEEKNRSEYILSLIEASERNITPTKSDEALADRAPTEPYANRIFQAMQGKSTKYEEYLKRPTELAAEDELIVLRGWSSAVTLLEGGLDRHWVGGGLFLQWKGHGLIIDPGFDFLDNFHEAGLHIRQVHGVAVSHDHPDHNGDLRSLDDLCYEVYRLNKIKGMKPDTLLFMIDEDTQRRLSSDSLDHRGSLCVFTGRGREDEVWFGGKRNNLKFQIQHFSVKHSPDVPNAQGFVINLLSDDLEKVEFSIGYTGDTKYFEELSDCLKGVDLLIAHVSQPDPQELNDETFYKDYHLGINGVARVAKETEAKLVVVGEFWAGIADHRMDIIGAIRHRAKTNAVIPAGLGLRIKLPKMTVICTRCGGEIPYSELRIAPPAAEFGNLGFLCKECLL